MLAYQCEGVKQADIARACDLDENMTSQAMRTLVAKGWIELRPHPADARANAVVVTEAGLALLAEARARIRPSNQAFFDPLRERLADFLAMLIDLNDAHSRTDPSAERLAP